jgi:integrase
MAVKLTDKVVRALAAPAQGYETAHDTEVPGFGCRVTAAGSKSFVLNYRVKGTGIERRLTIGSVFAWSAVAARERAKQLRREVDSGGDPLGDLRVERGAPIVAELAARFDAEHISKLRPRTQADYRGALRHDLLPVLGRMRVAAVDFEHTERLHRNISRRAPVRANRVAAVGSVMFDLAIKLRLRAANPFKGVRRNLEPPRSRYLTADELQRLGTVLAEDPDQQAAGAIRLLLLSGSRRTEVLSARWEQFNLEEGIWLKPHSAMKSKREHRLPLNAPARELLGRLPRDGGPWLFPGRNGSSSGHRVNIDDAWQRICKKAGLVDVRLHDLRHTHASVLAGLGLSLPTIAALLGHHSVRSSERYAHLQSDPLRRATERAGVILAGGAGKPTATVMSMKRRRRR